MPSTVEHRFLASQPQTAVPQKQEQKPVRPPITPEQDAANRADMVWDEDPLD